jgi:hypothetical protein
MGLTSQRRAPGAFMFPAGPFQISPLPIFAALLLGACALPDAPPELMTTLAIRSQLIGHMVQATAPGAPRQLIRFGRSGRAEIIGEESEFARWWADPERGLCLQQHETSPRCAPLYALSIAHYQWGDTRLDDLTVRPRGLGERDRGFDRPYPRR